MSDSQANKRVRILCPSCRKDGVRQSKSNNVCRNCWELFVEHANHHRRERSWSASGEESNQTFLTYCETVANFKKPEKKERIFRMINELGFDVSSAPHRNEKKSATESKGDVTKSSVTRRTSSSATTSTISVSDQEPDEWDPEGPAVVPGMLPLNDAPTYESDCLTVTVFIEDSTGTLPPCCDVKLKEHASWSALKNNVLESFSLDEPTVQVCLLEYSINSDPSKASSSSHTFECKSGSSSFDSLGHIPSNLSSVKFRISFVSDPLVDFFCSNDDDAFGSHVSRLISIKIELDLRSSRHPILSLPGKKLPLSFVLDAAPTSSWFELRAAITRFLELDESTSSIKFIEYGPGSSAEIQPINDLDPLPSVLELVRIALN